MIIRFGSCVGSVTPGKHFIRELLHHSSSRDCTGCRAEDGCEVEELKVQAERCPLEDRWLEVDRVGA